ncbi:MAG TPA: S8 family serine peptidase [Pseudobacteroides sp.]|uniref:S8 family peptidase n=1 Tax=Pseudobacteroides sp. TaxID=1968840 RepID=UPI002F92760F
MKHLIRVLAFVTAIIFSTWTIPIVHVHAAEAGRMEIKNKSYIFKLKNDSPEILPVGDASSIKHIPYTEDLYTTDSLEAIQSYIDAGFVEYVEPDSIVSLLDNKILLTPDPMFSSQWYMDSLEISSAWDRGLRGNGVTIAVVDSGVNISHEDLAGVSISGYNFIGSDTSDYGTDSTGHGTFVSGIIAAQVNNGKGIAGLTDKVNLLELRCFDSKTTRTSNVVSALEYAVKQNADVINMSFGGTNSSLATSLREQIDIAAKKGIILVSAVGNGDNGDVTSLNYPAAFESVVGVGMVDSKRLVHPHSQRNSSVFVTAPGVGLPGLGNSASDAYISSVTGTSYAAAFVTSLAAMAKQVNKSIDGSAFKKLLMACAVDDQSGDGYDTSYGYGIVNARLMAEALTKDYKITYNSSGGTISGTAGTDYPAAYRIDRKTDATLPIPVKNGYRFAGWYDDPTFTGNSITKVADNSVGDVKYFAKWEMNTTTAVKSITVQGVTAEVYESSNTIYNVTLPSNHSKIMASDFLVVPASDSASVTDTESGENPDTWTFDVTNEGESTTYVVNATLSHFARPSAKGALPTGESTPASSDGKIKVTPYLWQDIASWFNDVNAETAYSIVSSSGTGKAEISEKTLTYTPSESDAGKSVILTIRGKNGPFESTLDVTVSIWVNPVPANIITYPVTPISGGTASTPTPSVVSDTTVILPVSPNESGYGYSGSGESKIHATASTSEKEDNNSIYKHTDNTDEQNALVISNTADIVSNKLPSGGWINPFTDVKATDWYFDSVAFICEKGFFNGLSDKIFAPDASMTRSMLITVLYRIAGKPQVDSSDIFEDVSKGAWYENAVNWAYFNKIVFGINNKKFAPDKPVTRQEAAVILHNYDKYLKKSDINKMTSQDILNNFHDKEDVLSWAYEAMSWAVDCKLISGKTKSILDPAGTATRAEVAAILQRYCDIAKL